MHWDLFEIPIKQCQWKKVKKCDGHFILNHSISFKWEVSWIWRMHGNVVKWRINNLFLPVSNMIPLQEKQGRSLQARLRQVYFSVHLDGMKAQCDLKGHLVTLSLFSQAQAWSSVLLLEVGEQIGCCCLSEVGHTLTVRCPLSSLWPLNSVMGRPRTPEAEGSIADDQWLIFI